MVHQADGCPRSGRAVRSLGARGARRREGFSLIELLVVIAVITLLVGLLLPALRSARGQAAMTRELAAARELLRGWSAYAYDNAGVLLPGYDHVHALPIFDQAGNALSGPGPMAARYPWRLAPYFDYNFRSVYLDRTLLDGLESQTLDAYLISLFPSLGINACFVGGDTAPHNKFGIAAYNPSSEAHFGKFYLTRLAEPRHPARLITFASARVTVAEVQAGGMGDPSVFAGRSIVDGYEIVDPPAVYARQWVASYGAAAKARDFGYVALRHQRQAVTAFFDGSTGTLDEGTIQDMRHWADQADRPDWTLPFRP